MTNDLARLGELVRTLRAKCPWDRQQTHASLAPHLLEEAYEALDTIEALSRAEPTVPTGEVAHFQEELGDVLFQVFFHAELAAEKGRFTMADVARGIHDKLVSRHPHVFGQVSAETPEEVAARWEVLKRSEQRTRGTTDAIPEAMPALTLASKLLRRAASQEGGLPPSESRREQVSQVLDRLAHAEQHRERGGATEAPAAADEVGEALLALVDLAGRAGVDAETALRAAARRLREDLQPRE